MKFTTLKQVAAIVGGGVQAPLSDSPVTRRQDDTDGSTEMEHEILVYMGPDGDMYISQFPGRWLRFRTHNGGGISPRTHNALRILYEAIRLDNEERPQPLRAQPEKGGAS